MGNEIKQLIDVYSFSRNYLCLNSSFQRSCEDPYYPTKGGPFNAMRDTNNRNEISFS